MKTLTNPIIFLFMVPFLISCGGGKDDVVSVIPPEDDPVDSVNEAPSIPMLTYPSDNLICIENELEFSWQVSLDSDDDPISYNIQVANDEQFNDIAFEVSRNETTAVILLEKGQTFFWRAQAVDDQSNSSNYSPSWKFYTEGDPVVNQLPYQAELVSPSRNEVILSSAIVLSWTGSDPDDDSLIYDVYFGTSGQMPLVSEDLDQNTYEVTLMPNTLYYWQIVSKDGNGGVAFGPYWNFRTE